MTRHGELVKSDHSMQLHRELIFIDLEAPIKPTVVMSHSPTEWGGSKVDNAFLFSF